MPMFPLYPSAEVAAARNAAASASADAAELRQLAVDVRRTIDELRPYHRADVWRGARARRFGSHLAEHVAATVGVWGIAARLEDAATQLDRLAEHHTSFAADLSEAAQDAIAEALQDAIGAVEPGPP